MRELNIVIAGVGGQGSLLIEKIIGNSVIRHGYLVRASDTFGIAQRGGSVSSYLRIGSEVSSGLIPQGRGDIVLGLEPREALDAAARFLRRDGLIIVNTAPILPAKVKIGQFAYPPLKVILELAKELTKNVIDLDATALATQITGSERFMNVVLVGVLMGVEILPVSLETVRDVIKQLTRGLAQENSKAFEAGLKIGRERRTVNFAVVY